MVLRKYNDDIIRKKFDDLTESMDRFKAVVEDVKDDVADSVVPFTGCEQDQRDDD